MDRAHLDAGRQEAREASPRGGLLVALAAVVVSCSFLEDLERYDRGDEGAPPTATATTGASASSGTAGGGGGCAGDACEPCAGFGEPVIVAEEAAGHYGLAVDDERVYWLADGPPGVRLMSGSKEGGVAAPMVATDAGSPTLPSLVVDSAAVYWSFFGKKQDLRSGLLSRTAKQSDELAALAYAPYAPIGSLAVDGNNVYWAQSSGQLEGIHKTPKDASGDVFLVAADDAGALALDASNVYYCAAEAESYFIRRIPKTGAPDAGAVDVVTGAGRCMGLVLDGPHLYWTVDGGVVCRAPVEGGACDPLATEQDSPQAIVLDEQSIYWTTSDSIMCLPRGGGTPTAIASKQVEPRFLVNDAGSLFWMNKGVGVVASSR